MRGIFYIGHLVVNPDNWVVNLFITFAGVGLALALQELLNWIHRRDNTSKFAESLIEEINYNLLIAQSIIENCDNVLERLHNTESPFGFSAVFTVSGTALRFRKDAYEVIKQSGNHLSLSPEIFLKISKAYSRLVDINIFISTMVATWEASLDEAEREGVNPEIINTQRREQTRIIILGARAITIEAKTNLTNLLMDIRVF